MLRFKKHGPKTPKKDKKKTPKKTARWRNRSEVLNAIIEVDILKVAGKINNTLKENVLVDTGAKSNVIRRDVIEKLNIMEAIQPSDVRLSAANNSSLRVLGKINLSLEWVKENDRTTKENIFDYTSYKKQVDQMNTIEAEHSESPNENHGVEFIVVEELSVPIILGNRGIKQMKMKIDYERDEIIVNNMSYPFINTQRVPNVRVINKTVIKRRSINVIEVEADLEEAIYSIEGIGGDPLLQVVDSGLTAKEGKNRFKIFVKNFQDSDYTLEKDQVIATARNPINSDDPVALAITQAIQLCARAWRSQ